MVERLQEMGMVKQKLTIGEDDADTRKQFLPTMSHCKLNGVPDDVFALIINYVQNYFTCFDSNREALLHAYNPKVIFSITLNMANIQTHNQFRFDEVYYRENHNLKRLVGNDCDNRRHKLLHLSHIDTVSFFNKMPPTEHEPQSFKLDNVFFSPNMITFTVCGVFREGKATDRVRPIRSFSRAFVCVPDQNASMTIINEQFMLNNITQSQYITYYKEKRDQEAAAVAAASQVESVQQSAVSSASNTLASVPDFLIGLTEQQVQMIQQFSIHSRLTLNWCKDCLEYAGWNYEEAGKAFIANKDSIPKDAFLV